ncbi:circadian clock protein KaiC [Janthinobacterium sp. CG_23.3]|uniref:ATPase domain-containing protein n=1 Tax=unclassified Janthinobacterium TaxID=2610881 RepID=UPI0004775308|nr:MULTISPECIES: ATPase domain-containing protein [unclassified Janthinobacterium]MEC5161553.1 circadian clock protein KaiC [Janthinobacterium sp. CG_S6]
MNDKVSLGVQPSGVPGLDALLGGGLSEFSFNVIAGAPGTGKTTLAHQIMFGLASPQKKALFFTVLGEPPLKMLRYQQQFAFFDIDKVDSCIRYVNLAENLRAGDFSGVLERITREVETFAPGLVFVDSFRSVIQTAKSGNEGVSDMQHFVQELGTRMTSWQATTFLIGEYAPAEVEANPVMTVADGLFSLSQQVEQNSAVRKICIIKMRGHAHLSGSHTFRITGDGLRIYPRLLPPLAARDRALPVDQNTRRVSTGVSQLDVLLDGGLPLGHAVLVVGPSGSGKTILGAAFLAEGARLGEKGVLACFEKGSAIVRNARLAQLLERDAVSVVQGRALDLPVEELLDELVQEVVRTGATRVVIDSLSELGLYLAPEGRQDFRESVFRILATLANLGVTVLVTIGLEDRFTDMRFSQADTSFLVDAIVAMRYVEIEGRLSKVISVVKVRGSAHSTDLRHYVITDRGIEIDERPMPFEGLLSGHPRASTTSD